MAHPDLSLLEPEEGHKEILIDQVRSLQHTLALAPYQASYRIALLPNFQRATDQAKNALLKTLEEPPNKVILLVTASSPESLLPTVVSRCEVIRLRPASLAATRTYLQSTRELPDEKATLIAHLSGGRIGAAVHLADDPSALSSRQAHLSAFLSLLPARHYERFDWVEKMTKSADKARQEAGDLLPIWLSYWRDVFVVKSGADLPLVNADLRDEIDRTCAHVDEATARALVVAHEKAIHQLNEYANVRLLLETLMLRWPYISKMSDTGSM